MNSYPIFNCEINKTIYEYLRGRWVSDIKILGLHGCKNLAIQFTTDATFLHFREGYHKESRFIEHSDQIDIKLLLTNVYQSYAYCHYQLEDYELPDFFHYAGPGIVGPHERSSFPYVIPRESGTYQGVHFHNHIGDWKKDVNNFNPPNVLLDCTQPAWWADNKMSDFVRYEWSIRCSEIKILSYELLKPVGINGF